MSEPLKNMLFKGVLSKGEAFWMRLDLISTFAKKEKMDLTNDNHFRRIARQRGLFLANGG